MADSNILQLMQYVTDQGEAGRKSGLQKLMGQAYNAPEAQRQQILGAVAAKGEPGMALDAQKAYGAQSDDIHDRIIQRAGMVAALWKTNPQMAQAAYQGMPAMAAQGGFGQVPAQLDDKVVAALDGMSKLALSSGKTAGGDDMKSLRIGANGNFMAIRNGQLVDTGIQAAPNNQIIDTGNGFYGVNKGNLQAAPVNIGGQPQQSPQQAPPPQVTDGIDMQTLPGANVPQSDEVAMLAAAQNPGTQYVPQANGGAAPMAPPQQLRSVPKAPTAAEQQRLQIEQEHLRLAENADKRAASAASDTTAKPTPDEVDFYAQMSNAGDYSWATGMARGKSGQALIAAVRSRQVQLANGSGMAPQDVTANRASGAALTKTLADRQKYVTAVEQLNGTLNRQANLVESLMAKGAANGNSPVINKWIQAGRKATGDPDVAAFDAAIRGLGREHQRVLTGPLSNAQLAVSAAETADSLLNRDMTPAQIRATIQVMRTEARNGKEQGEQTLEDTRSQLRNMNRQQPAKPAGGILKFNPATGKIE